MLLVGSEDDVVKQPGAERDATKDDQEEDGAGLGERWLAKEEQEQERQQEIEVFFDAEGPDVREGALLRVADEYEVPGEGEVLPEGGGAGGFAPERDDRIEQKDGEVGRQDAIGAADA